MSATMFSQPGFSPKASCIPKASFITVWAELLVTVVMHKVAIPAAIRPRASPMKSGKIGNVVMRSRWFSCHLQAGAINAGNYC